MDKDNAHEHILRVQPLTLFLLHELLLHVVDLVHCKILLDCRAGCLGWGFLRIFSRPIREIIFRHRRCDYSYFFLYYLTHLLLFRGCSPGCWLILFFISSHC